MSYPRETILSTSSLSPYPTSSTAPTSSTPKTASPSSITLHDLQTSTQIHSFKPSNSLNQGVGVVNSEEGRGGGVFVVQEGKALLNFWAWQREQIQTRIHLPEKLSSFIVSPCGTWAAGGSYSGHLYIWEIASGLLLSSFDAHYRNITTISFLPSPSSPPSPFLSSKPTYPLVLTTSSDSSIHLYSLARLLDNAPQLQNVLPEPVGLFRGHTLGVTCVAIGKGGGRVWTGGEDGTVRIWSTSPPSLLTTFHLPPNQTPTSITVDPMERFFHISTTSGSVHLVKLYRRRKELGREGGEVGDLVVTGNNGGLNGNGPNALGGLGDVAVALGGGEGEIKLGEEGVINLGVPITHLVLSANQTQLISGTSTGLIHIHSLPSHQHLKTISTHSGYPITHLSLLSRPPDLVGHLSLGSYGQESNAHDQGGEYSLMEVRSFERMRVGRKEREEHEVALMLGYKSGWEELDELDPRFFDERDQLGEFGQDTFSKGTMGGQDNVQKVQDLQAELDKVRGQLKRAKEINDEMWKGVVKRSFAAGAEGEE